MASGMTSTYCTNCGRAIPYNQPRVRLQFMTGSEVTAWKEVCVRWCATRVLEAQRESVV